MVVNCHRKGNLGIILANDILVQNVTDLPGGRDDIGYIDVLFLQVCSGILQDAHTELDTLIADIGTRTCDDSGDLFLMLTAKGATYRALVVVFRHGFTSKFGRQSRPRLFRHGGNAER